MLLTTSTTPGPLKRMTTSLGIFVGNPDLCSSWKSLEYITSYWVRIDLIHPIHVPLSTYLRNVELLYLLSIHHETRDIHIIKGKCHTTLFFQKGIHPIKNLFILAPRISTKVRSCIESCVKFDRVLFNTHTLLMMVHEFHNLSPPQL